MRLWVLRAEHPDAFKEANRCLVSVFVPLVVPLFVGPGSLSTVILFAHRMSDVGTAIGFVVVIVLCCLLTCVDLMSAGFFRKVFGPTDLTIATRVLGLILAAIAMEFIIRGVQEAFNLGPA